MAVSDKIKALLNIKGKKSYELAEYLGMTPQAMRNKLSRDSFSAADLIKISDFLNCGLAFMVGDNQIRLEMSDIMEFVPEKQVQPLQENNSKPTN